MLTPAIVKRASGVYDEDFCARDLEPALRAAGLNLRLRAGGPKRILDGPPGLYLCLVKFFNDGELDHHWIGIDLWRMVVWDSAEEHGVPITTESQGALLRRLGYVCVLKAYIVYVDTRYLDKLGYV